mgnify:CR=1 FL=1
MDVKEAQKNLNELHDELVKYQNLSRAFMNSKQMMAIKDVELVFVNVSTVDQVNQYLLNEINVTLGDSDDM